ncbi:retrovirus-related pol polyprotein from transposon TNT 1-94 [Tanacetum coccineum]
MPELEDIAYSDDDEDVGVEADMNNLDAFMPGGPIPTTRIHKDHPVYRNKKDERGIVIKNKARLVAQGYIQEEGIDYDEVFAPVARIEVIRLFLAYASFKDFVVYQMDVKSAFLYGNIEEEVYVCQAPGFEDPDFPNRVYKVEKALYGLHQAPRACTVKQKEDGIFISQDKYVTEILKKFGFSDVKTANTPMETHKPLLKGADGEDVDEHMYRSMIGSLMYLTSSRPDIMFVCKKQTVVANSITEAEYVVASSYYGQVLWIQNQLMDYGYNFMHTKIYIDNESSICIVKNPVFHSKTKHIEIRHHFIRDYSEKKLIQMIKIHTDKNVADLLTKAFDKGIGVNAGDSKLMLLGINLLLLEKVNAARHNLLLLVFWATAKVKTVNGEVQLQALVDGKKVIITETSVRRDLQLEDAEGIECLPNANIFEQLL